MQRSRQSQLTERISAEDAIALYRTMLLIRLCEEELARCHQRGQIHGACHTYVGQEAIAAGVCAHLSQSDVVFSTHRGHGHALAKGASPRELMAELLGRETGLSRGRGGSMHLFAPEIGLMGTSGIVGPCILQAAGAGYSFKLLKTKQVAVALFGDGAANNGAFHEGLNMASIWKLPVLFVCENNQFATEVPFAYASGNPSIASRGAAYGIPGHEVDGNDVLATYEIAALAIERARGGQGPSLIECKTYRTRPHAEGMGDFTYRTREEVQAWKERCPILRVREALLGEDVASESELEAIAAEIQEIVGESRRFAEESPWPNPATASEHVYAAPTVKAFAQPVARVTTETLSQSSASSLETRQISYGQATLEALSQAMARDPHIFVMGEGIGARGGNFLTTSGLFDLYGGQRLCDTPICERGFVGLACGAAMTGSRPVIDFMFVDFVLDAVGEIINQIAKMQYMSSGRLKMPVLLRGCIGIGHSAATHHSGSYYSMFANVPGLRVVVPATPYDAKGLLAHALRCDDPVLFLEHRELVGIKGPVPEGDYEIEFGRASVVRRGTDITVVALARMVQQCLTVCDQLAGDGISVELIDPRTVSPLDYLTICESVHKTGRLLVVEESFGPCSVGAEIAAQIVDRAFDDLDAPVRRLNGAFTPTPYSPSLESAVVPQTDQIVAAIRELLAE